MSKGDNVYTTCYNSSLGLGNLAVQILKFMAKIFSTILHVLPAGNFICISFIYKLNLMKGEPNERAASGD